MPADNARACTHILAKASAPSKHMHALLEPREVGVGREPYALICVCVRGHVRMCVYMCEFIREADVVSGSNMCTRV